ncbi:MAG TPA: serine protease [Solirubrobacteraceae bacterium]|jgi:secreted trypsin-like serine protease|nr:serine protease [Solirubrobacteraceae bacterium]
MNGHGTALQRVYAAGATAAVLWVLGVGAVGSALAQGGPLRPSSGPVVAHASVVDGTEASISEFPFQVALYDPRAGSPAKGFFCGGVILGAKSVATAAHCLIGERGHPSPPPEIEVLAGSTYLEPTDPGSVRDPVVAVTVDPAYNPATSDYDVGVLRLAHPLWSGAAPALDGHDAIAPLVPDTALAARLSATGRASQANARPVQATVSGWGDLTPQPGDPPSYPRRLHKALVPLVPTGLCEEAYATIEQPITPRMLCAGGALPEGQGRTDSCYGDSGGPLIVPGQGGVGQPSGDVLLGLVDFGNGCAQVGYPGVYVRVADAAVANFFGVGPPLASAGGLNRGVCPRTVRGGHHHRSRRSAHRRRRCRA